MTSQDTAFRTANAIVGVGWAILFLLPSWQMGEKIILFVIFILLAAIYIYLLRLALTTRTRSEYGKPSFFTMNGVLALMSNPNGALAAWIHILAFDLIVGLYIRTQGAALDMSHWLLLPCYVLALMFGPLGLLLFLLLTLI